MMILYGRISKKIYIYIFIILLSNKNKNDYKFDGHKEGGDAC
jgi:hypothetical protein